MKGTHWGILGMALTGLALQINGLHDWHAALTPQFVSGAILAIGSTISGIKVDPPTKADDAVPMPRP